MYCGLNSIVLYGALRKVILESDTNVNIQLPEDLAQIFVETLRNSIVLNPIVHTNLIQILPMTLRIRSRYITRFMIDPLFKNSSKKKTKSIILYDLRTKHTGRYKI